MTNRNEIISKIKNRELNYKDIPEELKDDEEIALIAVETYDGRICEYIGEKLKSNKEFALKVFKKGYGYALYDFSENIKNDFDCCSASIVDGFSGYRYIGDSLKENKELALMEINSKHGHDIRVFPKKIKQDKDIIEAHWKKVFRDPSYFINFCSIISVDDFGNSIIEKFISAELQRHTKSRIERYEERTEPVQFIKCNNGKLEKEIFKPILNPLIIIIGNENNELINKIVDKYYDKDDKWINIIEIYKEDIDTKNVKFISKNENEIINLLRIITYTTAGDTGLTEDNLNDIKELLWKNDMENKNLKIKTFKGLDNLDTIESDFLNGNTFIIQVVSNTNHELHEYNEIADKFQKTFNKNTSLEFHLHMSCNFEGFEFYILKL